MGNGIIFMGLAFELFGICLGGYFVGHLIDVKMGWDQYATMTLILMLLAGWFVHLFYLLRRFDKENADSDDQS
jgi:hypothetical protein